MNVRVPFNCPDVGQLEQTFVSEALAGRHLSSGGTFGKQCEAILAGIFGVSAARLTGSCSAGLEIIALASGLTVGDEVIMPSFTFVTTATAFAMRGAIPVFVDIDEKTLNIDPEAVADAVTSRTRAVVPVHYGGISCDLLSILEIAKSEDLYVIEDAAQAFGCNYQNRPLGSYGDFAAVSFHDTKNVTAGEGGVVLINAEEFVDAVTVIRDKGTNRSLFNQGLVDRYTWVELGSSFGLDEIRSALLYGQLLRADSIKQRRLVIWNRYHEAFAELEERTILSRPHVPADCEHAGHMYFILAPDERRRNQWLSKLQQQGVGAVFHYIPLHESRGGMRFGRSSGDLLTTDSLASRIIRLPIWAGMAEADIDYVIEAVYAVVG